MAMFGNGICDVGSGSAYECDLFLYAFGKLVIFNCYIFIVQAIFLEEGLHVGRVFKERCEFIDHIVFHASGGDGLEIAGAVTFGTGAGVAAIVGAIALAGCHAPER